MTKQRQLIWNIIQKSCKHMTADEIYQIAKVQMPSIAVGTVYRNLNLMASDRDIRRLSVFGGCDRYDKNVISHEHLICRKCGSFADVSMNNLKGLLEKQAGVELDSYDLNMYYICPECYNMREEMKKNEQQCNV